MPDGRLHGRDLHHILSGRQRVKPVPAAIVGPRHGPGHEVVAALNPDALQRADNDTDGGLAGLVADERLKSRPASRWRP
jgi:hypothetical protein